MYQKTAHTYKRLVYAFYNKPDWENDYITLLHCKMLERYINVFDEVVFCIIIDDLSDTNAIKKIEKHILTIYNKNITFKIVENNNYRETYVFYTEIFLKMKQLDGLTFFAHTKGQSEMESREEAIAFILGSYFFSLENTDNIDKYPFYGSFKMLNNSPLSMKGNRYDWFYVGTFFWGNYNKIYNEHKNNFVLFSNRWFNEMFPGWLYESEKCGSLGNCYFDVAKGKPNNAFELTLNSYGSLDIFKDYVILYEELVKEFTEK